MIPLLSALDAVVKRAISPIDDAEQVWYSFLDEEKGSAVAPKRNIVDPVEDSTWELFCFEHNMHDLAQDDVKSELAPSHRPLRGEALELFTAMVISIIPTSFPEAKEKKCLKAFLKITTKLRSRTKPSGTRHLLKSRLPCASVTRMHHASACSAFSVRRTLGALPLWASANIKLAFFAGNAI